MRSEVECRRFFVAFLQRRTAGRSAGIPCLSPWERWPSSARPERASNLILSFKRRHTAFPLSVAFGDSSPKGRVKGLYTYRASKSTLVSRNSALPRRASKGNRARFLFGGSRVEVFRRRGKRNPRLLNDSLVTFCSHRKSPHGVAGSETLRKGSPRTLAPGRAPAPAPFIYTCAACIPTA